MADKDRSDIENTEAGVDTGEAPAPSTGESAEERAHRAARRRILIGGLASAPVILTLASRPAMAGGSYGGGHQVKKCGISGKLSGNLSHQHADNTTYCRGKKPKYWKEKDGDCKRHFETGPCNPIYLDYYGCNDYSIPTKYELVEHRKKLKRYSWNWYKIQRVDEYIEWLDQSPNLDHTPPFGTPFSEIFGPGIAQDDKLTLMQALWLDEESPHPPSGNAGPSPLLAHIAAAYCNACEYGKQYYGLSRQDVVDKVTRDIHRDPFKLEEQLRMLNDQG